MKIPYWFSRNSIVSHLRIPVTVVLIFAAAAMALFATFTPTAGLADVQVLPTPMHSAVT
jgi:hypothetical protein